MANVDTDYFLDKSGIQTLISELETNLVALEYSSSATYAVGDYCVHDNKMYRCTTAITTAENWNSAHWSLVIIGDELKSKTDIKVRQQLVSDNNNRPLIMSSAGTGNTTENVDSITCRNNSIYANASTGTITATKFVGDISEGTNLSSTQVTNALGYTPYNATNPDGYTKNTGTVTSVTIKGTSPIVSSSSSAITTSGTRTISHADSGVTAGDYTKVTVNATGHVTAGSNPTTLSGYGITDAKIESNTVTLGSNSIQIPTITDTYSGTSSDGMSGKAVKSAIDALDGGTIGTPSASKTLTALSQTNGNISATFADIAIANTQVSGLGTASTKDVPASGNASSTQVVMGNDTRLSNARTPTSHTHGNIQNGGTLQTNDITIASGDKLVVTDSSDSAKVARTSISFDGSTTTKALTQKGTWESFYNGSNLKSQAAASGGTDVSLVTTGEKYTWNNKVDRTGDTMTGGLTIKVTGTYDSNSPARLALSTVDSTNNVTSTGSISAYDGGAYGTNLVIHPSGNMFLGSGEAAYNHFSAAYTHSATERMFLTSDEDILIQSNGQTIANRAGFRLSAAGNIVPEKADVDTDNIGSIGTSTYRWANGYFTNINGVAVGTPKFTDTTYTLGTNGDKVKLTPSSGSAQEITTPYATDSGYLRDSVTSSYKIRYINSNDATTWTSDTLGATDSIAVMRANVTGAWTTGHIVTFNVASIGTPFQLGVHDSSELYFYKRYKTSGTWGDWVKMKAGDSDKVNGLTVQTAVPANAVFTDQFVSQSNTTTSNWRKVLLGYQNDATKGTAVTAQTNVVYGNSAFEFQPSTGTVRATNFSGTLTGNAYEANLMWGGKNHSASYGCIDAAMVSTLGGNRLAVFNDRASAITIEYTRDGGSTWTDYGASNDVKTGIFNGGGDNQWLGIGKADSTNKATANADKYQLRITIDTGAANIYTDLNKVVVFISTNGSNSCTCQVQKALQSTPTTFVNHTDPIAISGWSGYNVINFPSLRTYGNTAASQYGRVRFLFKANGGNTSYTGLQICRIMGFGGMGWNTPSDLARTGHVYGYDSDQNIIFPVSARFKGTGTIQYQGTKSLQNMIKFVDNAADTYGNGIVIGGGGATIIGGGESATTMAGQLSTGGDEVMYICNDSSINFYTNCNNGASSAVLTQINTSGVFTGKSAKVEMPRVNETANKQPRLNTVQFREVQSGNEGLPSSAWYYIQDMQGSDGNYTIQLAYGETTNAVYYRRKTTSGWGDWSGLINSNTWRTISINSGSIGGRALNLISGTNVSFTETLTDTVQNVTINATDTNTTYTFANGTNGFTVTPSGGTPQTVTVTPSITNNVTGSGTSGYIAKFNGTNTITNGPAFGSATTTYLRNDGSWATPVDTKVNQILGTDNNNRPLLMSSGSINNTTATIDDGTIRNNSIYANPSNGMITATMLNATDGVRVGSNATGGGLALWSTNSANYGITMRTTGTASGELGKHGYVQGDYAVYFCMNTTTSSTTINRGWIFRHARLAENVASINANDGNAVFKGSVTIGGNATNDSGARLEFDSSARAVNFVFV